MCAFAPLSGQEQSSGDGPSRSKEWVGAMIRFRPPLNVPAISVIRFLDF